VKLFRVRGDRDADLPLPKVATPGSSGADLHAAIAEPLTLAPGVRALVPTGFALEIPRGFEAQVRPRSGLALRHGIVLPNSPGTIDSDFRGEVCVLLMNLGDEDFVVRRGDRIAQLVLCSVSLPHFEEVRTELELGATARGAGGFGHSGR